MSSIGPTEEIDDQGLSPDQREVQRRTIAAVNQTIQDQNLRIGEFAERLIAMEHQLGMLRNELIEIKDKNTQDIIKNFNGGPTEV